MNVCTMDDELVNLSMVELAEFHRLNKQMIAKLEEENNAFRQQIKCFGSGAELAQSLNIIQRTDGSTNLDEIKRTLHNDILTLKRRLSETTKLTGISISHVEETSVEVADDVSCKSVALVVTVLGNDIVLKCDVVNVLSSENGKELEGGIVSWLEVQIPRAINDAIGDAAVQITQEAAIHPILCLIKSYLQCFTEREELLRHFSEIYPDCVKHWFRDQKRCQGLWISTQKARQPAFEMEWTFQLQENFRYLHDVKLVVKLSEELKTKDSKGVLDSAPEMFTHMKSLLGLKTAIDRFIRMVMSEGEDIMSFEELQSLQKATVND